ncbi:MAG: helix-turn-helix transcriptional regulator [Clostridia bacterium]|nr:helix-turn-helix transcriptional regulator [Clostridia bacterium]
MDIGHRIITLLKAQNMSQKALSEQTSLTPSYINQICLNKKVPTLDTLERICAGLGTDIETFFSGSGNAALPSAEEQQLLYHYRSLTESERCAVLTIVRSLSGESPAASPKSP